VETLTRKNEIIDVEEHSPLVSDALFLVIKFFISSFTISHPTNNQTKMFKPRAKGHSIYSPINGGFNPLHQTPFPTFMDPTKTHPPR